MAFGVWLHLTERHAHDHTHETIEHEHAHVHDEHHRHAHEGTMTSRIRTRTGMSRFGTGMCTIPTFTIAMSTAKAVDASYLTASVDYERSDPGRDFLTRAVVARSSASAATMAAEPIKNSGR